VSYSYDRTKEAGSLDMDLAKTYADAWSPTLIGKLAPKFVSPAKLGDVLQPIWFDQVGSGIRSLQWRSSRWMKAADWGQQMKMICPEYNGFHAGKVGTWLSHFDVEVQPAREHSVCIYIKGAPESLATIENMAKRAVHADEVDLQDDGTLRLWWD